jgi:putative FmdB family regulatory protein
MPIYEYRCQKCNKKFTVTCRISEHEGRKIRCPKCNATKLAQVFSPFFAKTDSKS